jgi:hypothetical protein
VRSRISRHGDLKHVCIPTIADPPKQASPEKIGCRNGGFPETTRTRQVVAQIPSLLFPGLLTREHTGNRAVLKRMSWSRKLCERFATRNLLARFGG